eukprot:1175793-Prorocentrum_minimum.AAC.3
MGTPAARGPPEPRCLRLTARTHARNLMVEAFEARLRAEGALLVNNTRRVELAAWSVFALDAGAAAREVYEVTRFRRGQSNLRSHTRDSQVINKYSYPKQADKATVAKQPARGKDRGKNNVYSICLFEHAGSHGIRFVPHPRTAPAYAPPQPRPPHTVHSAGQQIVPRLSDWPPALHVCWPLAGANTKNTTRSNRTIVFI